MFAAMIFDLDGVLADTHPIHRRVWRQFLLEEGRAVSEEDLEFVEEGYKLQEIILHFFGDLSPSEILGYGMRKRQLFYQAVSEIRPCAGVVDLLQELQSERILRAVATSADRLRANVLLANLGLAQYFTCVVAGDDVTQGKPDPAVFKLAAQRLDVPPYRCLAAEDSWTGVRAAKLAGMKCLAIGTGQRAARLLSEGADYVVPSTLGLSINEMRNLFSTSSEASGFGIATPEP